MARICPLTKEPVLYLECTECEDKVCRQFVGKPGEPGKKEVQSGKEQHDGEQVQYPDPERRNQEV